MKYLVMNSNVIHQFSTNQLSEPVGVLKLDYKTTTAISRLLAFTQQPLNAVPQWNWAKDHNIHLASSEFTGPSVKWITSLSDAKLSSRQREQFEKNRYVVTNRKPVNLTGVAWSRARFFITMYKQMYWKCTAGEDYAVYGPPTNKWEQIANHAINHLLSEARKSPLSWEDTWYTLRFSAGYIGREWREIEQSEDYVPEIIAEVINAALEENRYREKLTPVEIVHLETTRRHWETE